MLNFLSFLSEAKAFHGSKEGIEGPITTTRGPFFMVPSSPYQGKADAGERVAAAYAERQGVSVESGEGPGSSDAMVYRVEMEKPASKRKRKPRVKRKSERPHRQEAEAALAASPSGLSREARLRQIARVMPKLTGGLKGGVFSRTGRETEELVVPKYARANIRVTGERYADEPEGKFRPSKVRGMSRSWRPFMGVSAVRGVPLSGERRMAAIAAHAPDTNPHDDVPVYRTRNAG
jgi:hypothetical protein